MTSHHTTPTVIPRPRPGEPTRFLNKYVNALNEIDEWAMKKHEREALLRAHYAKKDPISAQFLIDRDQEVAECQIMIDRATARAAALGAAALLEAQGRLV